ncbi:hypothetical protein BT67DRAFT_477187 [Trichocladium antarcticum]|uniref:Uncharacterized protein n=1 Tax=Trichocladium antarcticum TaxID=1450529 RepID=A0AAN6UTY8_9PEZI|nr:hypothetical protein BT67DRAFT_477187 [Trichocladium antarcticum]
MVWVQADKRGGRSAPWQRPMAASIPAMPVSSEPSTGHWCASEKEMNLRNGSIGSFRRRNLDWQVLSHQAARRLSSGLFHTEMGSQRARAQDAAAPEPNPEHWLGRAAVTAVAGTGPAGQSVALSKTETKRWRGLFQESTWSCQNPEEAES